MKEELSKFESETLERLLAKVAGRGQDLPWTLFRFVTEVTPTANVDLIVSDPKRGVLLAWRSDKFGTGWHVPGSIIRHREEIEHRLEMTAQVEFGCELSIGKQPIALIQIFDDRGHSISLCYQAKLVGSPRKDMARTSVAPEAGDLCWFETAPIDLYPSHAVYRDILNLLSRDELGAGIKVFTQHTGKRDATSGPEGLISAEGALD